MKLLAAFFISLSILCIHLPADAEPPDCFRDIERTFFEPSYVMGALSLHGELQGLWVPITNDLQAIQGDVERRVRARAEQMHPNPLDNPFNTHAAALLLMDELFRMFSETMHAHIITNESDIHQMFYYIRGRNIPKLKACFGDKVPLDWYKENN